MHNKSYVPRKDKTTYNLEQGYCVFFICNFEQKKQHLVKDRKLGCKKPKRKISMWKPISNIFLSDRFQTHFMAFKEKCLKT